MASCVLLWAWPIEVIWAASRLAAMRPDGSSAAPLMRRPVERRVMDLLISVFVELRWFIAVIAGTLVLMLNMVLP